MFPRVDSACGIDVHRSKLTATIIDASGSYETKNYSTQLPDLIRLRDWIVENNCSRVLMEATGVYWVPVYTILEHAVPTFVANLYFIKCLLAILCGYFEAGAARVSGGGVVREQDDRDDKPLLIRATLKAIQKESGVYLLLAALETSPALLRCICGHPFNLPAKHVRTGTGRWEKRLSEQILMMIQTPDNQMMTCSQFNPQ